VIDALLRLIEQIQGAIFLGAAQPVLYALGLMDWSDEVFDGIEFALFGALEIILAYLLFRPLELWRPVEQWPSGRAVRTDIVYSLVGRLGVVPAIIFLLLTPIGAAIDSTLRFEGYIPGTLDQLIPLLQTWPFVTFLIYVAVIDLAEYWRHRLQHRLSWWWALHSIHHDQRQMTLWTDDRNHLLDDVLTSVWRGTIAMLIGIAPAEYPLLMIGFRLIESLSHTNVRLRLGWIGTLLLVGPQYHRSHHAIEHARAPFDRTMGCNFAVILPVWDVLFRTRRSDRAFPATGVASLAGEAVSCGYVSHQLEGFRRLGAVVVHWFDHRRPGFAAEFGGRQSQSP
jgi:sterol desaturase/sphingolipid hydroxylase (fatty acid hydroxylase superfamily)